MKRATVALLLVVASVSASAEIEKLAVPSDDGFRFYWWPKLPAVAGWLHDEATSLKLTANVLVPDGSSFGDAPAVMYAKALYKPRSPEIHSLQELIDSDRDAFEHDMPGLKIERLPDLTTGDRRHLIQLAFAPKGEGSWERVAYGEEDDYYLIFAISAQHDADLKAALPAFETLVAGYKRQL
jgi:hypothetical protein